MSYDLSWSTEFAPSIAVTHVSDCWLKLFLFVMFTVFYHEQKTSHDEKVVKGLYFPISTSIRFNKQSHGVVPLLVNTSGPFNFV